MMTILAVCTLDIPDYLLALAQMAGALALAQRAEALAMVAEALAMVAEALARAACQMQMVQQHSP